MAGKNTSVFGIYSTYSDVENGVDALKAAGFPEHRYFGTVSGKCGIERFCP